MRGADLCQLCEDAILETRYFLLQHQLYSLAMVVFNLTGTASMTKSTSASSSIVVEALSRDRVDSASSLVIRCFAISFSNNFSVQRYYLHCGVDLQRHTCELGGFIQRSLRSVDQDHRHLCSLRCDQSNTQALDHSEFIAF